MSDNLEPLTAQEIEELKRLEAAATPGPWKVFTATEGHKVIGIGEMTGDGVTDCGFGIWRYGEPQHLVNAQIIAATHNALPRLIAGYEAKDAELSNLRRQLAEKDAEIERLHDDLDTYGRHTDNCITHSMDDMPCDCHYVDAVKREPKP